MQDENASSNAETTSELGSPASMPGLQESMLCMSNILHGVVLNGLLVWADIQRRTTAENIWKEEARKYFTKDELTDAKEILWDVADKTVLRKMIKRRETSKSNAEINDISNALKKFSENEVMPIFLGTSNMVMPTPLFNPDAVGNMRQ